MNQGGGAWPVTLKILASHTIFVLKFNPTPPLVTRDGIYERPLRERPHKRSRDGMGVGKHSAWRKGFSRLCLFRRTLSVTERVRGVGEGGGGTQIANFAWRIFWTFRYDYITFRTIPVLFAAFGVFFFELFPDAVPVIITHISNG